MLYAVNQVSVAEFIWSAANQVLVVQLCCSQRIRFSLLNSLTAALQVFAAQYVVAMNYIFKAKLCCPWRIRSSLSNYVLSNESSVCCPIVLFTANYVFKAKLCCSHRIRCSLSNYVLRNESGFCCWICGVRIESGVRCSNCVVHSKSGFYSWILLTAAIKVFVAKFCWPQQFKFSLPKFVWSVAKLCFP